DPAQGGSLAGADQEREPQLIGEGGNTAERSGQKSRDGDDTGAAETVCDPAPDQGEACHAAGGQGHGQCGLCRGGVEICGDGGKDGVDGPELGEGGHGRGDQGDDCTPIARGPCTRAQVVVG